MKLNFQTQIIYTGKSSVNKNIHRIIHQRYYPPIYANNKNINLSERKTKPIILSLSLLQILLHFKPISMNFYSSFTHTLDTSNSLVLQGNNCEELPSMGRYNIQPNLN